jgi:quinol monooxygenase YgiN
MLAQPAMYARVTTFKVDPSRLDELTAKITELSRLIKALPGMVDAYATWREDGQGVVIAIYQSREHADAAMRRLQVIWGSIADLLIGAPRTDTYERVEHITR